MATLDTVVIKITGDSKDIDKTINQLEKVGKVDRQNAKSFKKTSAEQGKAMDFVKGKALAMGGALLGAFAIKQVVGNAINILKTFEKEMSTLQSITGSTEEQMQFFAKASKDVGRATKTAATDVVKAFTLIGSAQPELLKNSKALAEVTKQSLILSKAAGIDATQAATALTSAMNQFGVEAKDAAKFTDIFATSQQKGSSFITATSEALKNVGATANAAGISFETTNAAIQALAKGALTGSEAGTALRGVLAKLSSQSDRDINPSMVGLGKTIDELESRNLSLAEATKLVGLESATGLLTLIKQNKLFKELDGNLNEVGNAMSQMAINTDNLDGALDEAGNAWEDLVLSFSNSDGILTTVVEHLTAFLRGVTDGEFAVRKLDKSLKDLSDDTLDNIEILKAQEKELEFMIGILIRRGNVEGANKIQQDLIDVKTKLRIEQIKSEKEALEEKTKAEQKATVAAVAAAVAKAKQLGAIGLLKRLIADLTKELLDQSLAGDIDTKSVLKLQEAIEQLEKAELDLKVAMTPVTKEMERQKILIDDIANPKAKDGGQPKSAAETEAQDQRIRNATAEKRLENIDRVSQAEQQAFGILAQLNTNKLIGIDNEETKALRALEAQGLGEEELAKRRTAIQQKAAARRAELLTKQAKADKAAALFQSAINTAVAITSALTVAPPLGFVLAGISAALGAAEIAAIAAQPIPVFHEGKKPELKEGEMFAKIQKSEAVIPSAQSKKYKGAIDSMIDQKFERYVFDEYMMPIMKGMSKGNQNSTEFDDYRMWSNQRKQIKLSEQTLKAINNLNAKPYNPWGGGGGWR